MLAQAKAQPDRWARDLNAGVGAVQDTAGGYMRGLQMKRQMQEYPLELAGKQSALYDHLSKLSEQYGPDKAAEIMTPVFKSVGLTMPTSGGSGATNYTPQQLASMGGTWATKQLGNQNVIGEMKKRDLDIENNQPFSTDVANFIGKGDMEGLTKYHAAKNETVPYREVQQLIAAKRPQFMQGLVGLKGSQAVLAALPSHQPTGTPARSASDVQFSVRQGKALIANASTDPKRIGLASLDAARSVLRAAPQIDAIRGADYSDTLMNTLNNLGNKLSSGKVSPQDLPIVRKQLFDAFSDLENSSRPLIARELSHAERTLGPQGFLPPEWENMKKDEMGVNFPDIPFDPGSGSTQNPNISSGIPQGKVKVSKGNESYYIDPAEVPNAQKDGFIPS